MEQHQARFMLTGDACSQAFSRARPEVGYTHPLHTSWSNDEQSLLKLHVQGQTALVAVALEMGRILSALVGTVWIVALRASILTSAPRSASIIRWGR